MDAVNPMLAEGADLVDGEWVRNIFSYPPIGSPDGGDTTAADLTRFLEAIHRSELLGNELTDLFLSPQVRHSVDESGELHYGLGLEFRVSPTGSVVFYEKEGINAGASAVLRHYPDSGTTVVLLSNMQTGVWEPRRFIHALITDAA